ncbi:MAG: peptidylprolyl isomerase [Planctomycetota bacterium]|jgi:cyclophilin family peptidyl-prolyl cis-trans isomerase
MSDKAIDAIDAFIESSDIDTGSDRWRLGLPKPPKVDFEPGKGYIWKVTTNHGPIEIKLFTEDAPMHASSTIFLSRLGFYDGLSFHRVISNFMAQGGCPLGSGTGGPGYKYDGEFGGSARHDKRGLLSMANAGPGTDGSQFFLTFVETPWLDGKHTLFGEVVSGMEVLDALEARGSDSGATKEPLSMEKTEIEVR